MEDICAVPMWDDWSSLRSMSIASSATKWWPELLRLGQMPLWQAASLLFVLAWLVMARSLGLTQKIRSVLQPLVVRQVERGAQTVLLVQRLRTPVLDKVLATLAILVSIEFYTAFLPLFFWTGNGKLGRQMVILMALGIYVGNVLKDVVSAPRPPSPPIWRQARTENEKENGKEYGLPSSHTINTLSLSLYFVLFYMREAPYVSFTWMWCLGIGLGLINFSVIFGRIYLGYHSLIDIAAGAVIGGTLPVLWLTVDQIVDNFILNGDNVEFFHFCIAVLGLFAYPAPQAPTPSYSDHTAFNGVVLGIVLGSHRLHARSFLPSAPLALSTLPGVLALLLRIAVGLPVIVFTKSLVKELATRFLPTLCVMSSFSVYSSEYVKHLLEQDKKQYAPVVGTDTQRIAFEEAEKGPVLHIAGSSLFSDCKSKEQLNFSEGMGPRSHELQENLFPSSFSVVFDKVHDVDIGIRLASYTALGFAAVHTAPTVFLWLGI